MASVKFLTTFRELQVFVDTQSTTVPTDNPVTVTVPLNSTNVSVSIPSMNTPSCVQNCWTSTGSCSRVCWMLHVTDATAWPFQLQVFMPTTGNDSVVTVGFLYGSSTGPTTFQVQYCPFAFIVQSNLGAAALVTFTGSFGDETYTLTSENDYMISLYEIAEDTVFTMVVTCVSVGLGLFPPAATPQASMLTFQFVSGTPGTSVQNIMYATPYLYKQFCSVECAYPNNGQAMVTIDTDGAELGFSMGTFGLPPSSLTGQVGFFKNFGSTLFPAELFQIFQTEAANNCAYLPASPSTLMGFQPTNPVGMANSMFAFLPDPNGNTRLIVCSNDAETTGFFAAHVSAKTMVVTATKSIEEVAGEDPSGEWGLVAMVSTGRYNGVVILYRNSNGNYVLNPNGGQLEPLTDSGFTLDSPPGFMSASSTTSTAFIVYLLPLSQQMFLQRPDPYIQTCFVLTPYGCDGTLRPLARTADLCTLSSLGNSSNCGVDQTIVSDELQWYQKAGQEFLYNSCAVLYNGSTMNCNEVAGTAVSACSGWGVQDLDMSCDSACTAVGPEGCDAVKSLFCSQPNAYDIGDCSCINVYDSAFPSAFHNNTSYPCFIKAMEAEYLMAADTNLYPQAWWPTCAAIEGAITLSNTDVAVPKTLENCISVLKCMQAVDSNVTVNVGQECFAGEGPGSPFCNVTLPPSSGSPGGVPGNVVPRPSIPLRPFDYIIIGVVSVVAFGLLLAVTRFAYQRVSAIRQQRAPRTKI